jgi:hypothetical protein
VSDASERRPIELTPMRRLGELPPDPYSRPPARQRLRSLVGVLLVISLFLLLMSLSFANVTAEGPAKRSLRESVAVLTEVDAYLDDHWEAFQDEAASAPPAALVSPPDFPVGITFAAQEVTELGRDEFRALLLTRAGDRIYDDGASAFEEEGSDPSPASLEGLSRNGLDFLRPRPHDVLALATVVAAIACGVLAAALVGLSRGYGRLLALGVAIVAAAGPFLLFAVAAHFGLRIAADNLGDAAADGLLGLARQLTWAPLRNGAIFAGGGLVLLMLGLALERWPALTPGDQV